MLVRSYLVTLKGLARQCEYSTEYVSCQKVVDSSLDVIQEQLIYTDTVSHFLCENFPGYNLVLEIFVILG